MHAQGELIGEQSGIVEGRRDLKFFGINQFYMTKFVTSSCSKYVGRSCKIVSVVIGWM